MPDPTVAVLAVALGAGAWHGTPYGSFSPDSRWYAEYDSSDRNHLWIWDTRHLDRPSFVDLRGQGLRGAEFVFVDDGVVALAHASVLIELDAASGLELRRTPPAPKDFSRILAIRGDEIWTDSGASWDRATGAWTEHAVDPDFGATLTVDGAWLASCDYHGASLWDLAAGATEPVRVKLPAACSTQLLPAPSGHRVWFPRSDGTVVAVDADSGAVGVPVQLGSRSSFPRMAASRGALFVGDGEQLRVLSLDTGEWKDTLSPGIGRIDGFEASPDGRVLVLSDADGRRFLVDGRSGRVILDPPPAHRREVHCAWWTDDHTLRAIDATGRMSTWNADDRTVTAWEQLPLSDVWHCAGDGDDVVLTANAGLFQDSPAGLRQVLEGHGGPDGAIALSAATGGWAEGTSDGAIIGRFGEPAVTRVDLPGRGGELAFSPQGDRIAVIRDRAFVDVVGLDGAVLATTDLSAAIAGSGGKDGFLSGLSWTADGRAISLAAASGWLWIYQVGGLQSSAAQLVQGMSSLSGLAALPDGGVVAYGGYDAGLAAWRPPAAPVQVHDPLELELCRAFAVSPDGARVAIGCEDGELFLEDVPGHRL